mmetsp:Transcript_6044/g.13353  ORF Transcript_6044/g.13353 Transcript_6044/m.13353 type:complete len:1400 (+) Transcript_6044:90-4289(+)
MRARKAEEAFIERLRGRTDRTPPPTSKHVSQDLAATRRTGATSRTPPPQGQRNAKADHAATAAAAANPGSLATSTGVAAKQQEYEASLERAVVASRSIGSMSSQKSNALGTRLDSLGHLRLALDSITSQELAELSQEVNQTVDAEGESFLQRPSWDLEVKVVALLCAMGLADDSVSVESVLDDELPLDAWIAAQRMLRRPAEVLHALRSFPPQSGSRWNHDAPWPGLALQAARVFLAQQGADDVQGPGVLSHLQFWIQAAVLHFDPSMTTYVDESRHDLNEDSLLELEAIPTQKEDGHEDDKVNSPPASDEHSEVAALFCEGQDQVDTQPSFQEAFASSPPTAEERFQAKLPSLGGDVRVSTTSLFLEEAPLMETVHIDTLPSSAQKPKEKVVDESHPATATPSQAAAVDTAVTPSQAPTATPPPGAAAVTPSTAFSTADVTSAEKENPQVVRPSFEEMLKDRVSQVLGNRAESSMVLTPPAPEPQVEAEHEEHEEVRLDSEAASPSEQGTTPVREPLQSEESSPQEQQEEEVMTAEEVQDVHSSRIEKDVVDMGRWRALQREAAEQPAEREESSASRPCEVSATTPMPATASEDTPLKAESHLRATPGTASSQETEGWRGLQGDSINDPITFNGDMAALPRWQAPENTSPPHCQAEATAGDEEPLIRKTADTAEVSKSTYAERVPSWQQHALREANRPLSTEIHAGGKENCPPRKHEVARKLSMGPTSGLDTGKRAMQAPAVTHSSVMAKATPQPPHHGSTTSNLDSEAYPSPTGQLQFEDSADLEVLCKALQRAAAVGSSSAPKGTTSSSSPSTLPGGALLQATTAPSNATPKPVLHKEVKPSTSSEMLLAASVQKQAVQPASLTPPARQWPYVSPAYPSASPWPWPAHPAGRAADQPSSGVSQGMIEHLQTRAPLQSTNTSLTPQAPGIETPAASREGSAARYPAGVGLASSRTPITSSTIAPTVPFTPSTATDDVQGIMARLRAVQQATLQPTPRTTPRAPRLSEPADSRVLTRTPLAATPRMAQDTAQSQTPGAFLLLHEAAEKVRRPNPEPLPKDDPRGGLERLIQSVQAQQRRQSTPHSSYLNTRGSVSADPVVSRMPAGTGTHLSWRKSTHRYPEATSCSSVQACEAEMASGISSPALTPFLASSTAPRRHSRAWDPAPPLGGGRDDGDDGLRARRNLHTPAASVERGGFRESSWHPTGRDAASMQSAQERGRAMGQTEREVRLLMTPRRRDASNPPAAAAAAKIESVDLLHRPTAGTSQLIEHLRSRSAERAVQEVETFHDAGDSNPPVIAPPSRCYEIASEIEAFVDPFLSEVRGALSSASRMIRTQADRYGKIGIYAALVMIFIFCMWCMLILAAAVVFEISRRAGQGPKDYSDRPGASDFRRLQGYL